MLALGEAMKSQLNGGGYLPRDVLEACTGVAEQDSQREENASSHPEHGWDQQKQAESRKECRPTLETGALFALHQGTCKNPMSGIPSIQHPKRY